MRLGRLYGLDGFLLAGLGCERATEGWVDALGSAGPISGGHT